MAIWDWFREFFLNDSASFRDLLVSVGVPFLIWREWNTHRTASAAQHQAKTAEQRHQKQTEADRERRVTDIFSKAIELLGKEELEARLGAIYALERIAHESKRDHWAIMETLTAYVRNRHPVGETADDTETPRPRPILAVDAQSVLTVISHRSREYERPDQRIDLSHSMLASARLKGADLEGANLAGADLRGADLEEANLKGAEIWGANLENANLTSANLNGAGLDLSDLAAANLTRANLNGASLFCVILRNATLQRAKLEGANLDCAGLERAKLDGAELRRTSLRGARLQMARLGGANLEGANLEDANIKGADFKGANLEGADFKGANLEGADFTDANLTGAKNWPVATVKADLPIDAAPSARSLSDAG